MSSNPKKQQLNQKQIAIIATAAIVAIYSEQKSPFSRTNATSFASAARAIVNGKREILQDNVVDYFRRIAPAAIEASFTGQMFNRDKNLVSEKDADVSQAVLGHMLTEGNYTLRDTLPTSDWRRYVIAEVSAMTGLGHQTVTDYFGDMLQQISTEQLDNTFGSKEIGELTGAGSAS